MYKREPTEHTEYTGKKYREKLLCLSVCSYDVGSMYSYNVGSISRKTKSRSIE